MCWVAVLLLTFGYFSSFLHILGINFHFRETLYFLYSGQAPLLYLAPWQPSEEGLSRLLLTWILAEFAVERGQFMILEGQLSLSYFLEWKDYTGIVQ